MPIVEMIETTEADGTQTTTKQIFKVLLYSGWLCNHDSNDLRVQNYTIGA